MSSKLDKILAEISAGELIDKITILEIKKAKILNKEKLVDIEKELASLNSTMKKFIPDQSKISKLIADLREINFKLWDIEDDIRIFEKKSNFYMIGSMGLSSSIGLGIALKNLKKTVFVFDGDGNILMNLGSLATIGSIKPRNLIHIVFDNELHESTGSQPTISKKIQIDKLAKTLEYKTYKATTKKELENILNKIKKINGPILILIKISKSRQTSKRVNINPIKIKQRFMESLNQ